MNGSEEAGGGRERQQSPLKSMNNQQTPSDRPKMACYGHHITFGTMGDNDEDIRTENYIVDGNIPTPDDDDSVSQPQRPSPPPEPPPPLRPRRTKPGTGTNDVIRQRHGKRTAGDETKGSKTTTAILECAGMDKQESLRPPPPPAPPPRPPRQP